MSGTQSALFGGGSRWITNPKHLPIFSITDAGLAVKSAANTVSVANSAGFHTAMASQGASASISVANTYVTLVNASGGGGFLFHCVSPTHSASATPTIRITVDGTVYTFAPSAAFAAQKRLVIGAGTPWGPTTTIAGTYSEAQVQLPNSYGDTGFQTRVGGVNSRVSAAGNGIGLPEESILMSFNMPLLRFESSLLIEMKCDLLSGVAVDKQCSVAYRLDM